MIKTQDKAIASEVARAMVIVCAISAIQKRHYDRAITLLEEVLIKMGYEDLLK